VVTTAGVAAFVHVAFDFGWQASLLLGVALAPTDPAVVFSVLGRREITGRSGTVLEGESGANDPVGIAAMAALPAAGSTGGPALPALTPLKELRDSERDRRALVSVAFSRIRAPARPSGSWAARVAARSAVCGG
jgi:hypothetical protein